MQGLKRIPSDSQLAEAYDRLQAPQLRHQSVNVEEWALWSQWARLDPRLAEIWCARMSVEWTRIAPFSLGEALRSQPWPAAAGVLLSQTEGLIAGELKKPFIAWCAVVLHGVEPSNGEAFFIGQRAFAGKLLREDARLSLTSYTRWGYFGRELLVNKAVSRARPRTLLPVARRHEVLEELILECERRGASLGVQDYLEALGPGVARRVAELDLQRSPRLRSRGIGRGKRYLPRPRRAGK